MARIKLVYIGGGSTRAPGAMASFIERAADLQGSEIVLVDLNAEHLDIVRTLTQKMARGLDLTITATTDRKAALQDCDGVLTSFRPGGFEARYLDESIPRKHGILGQETQGPGGFFMALRSIHVMRDILADMEAICPDAWLINYTNPINIVSEAVTHHSPMKAVSLCEGPIIFPEHFARRAGLDPKQVDATMIGLNHGSWSVRHRYQGQDMMPLLRAAYEQRRDDPTYPREDLRLLKLAVTMESIPADYFQYYYFNDEIVAEQQLKPTTRAQDIMAKTPDNWAHYREQAASDRPQLDPKRVRGGIGALEIAVEVIDAIFNDTGRVLPVNMPNGGALPDFPDDLVVEVPGYIRRDAITPLAQGHLPRHVVGLVKALGEYQALTAEAAWSGNRREAIRALASHPFMHSLDKTEAIYDEMAAAHRAYLPERLLK